MMRRFGIISEGETDFAVLRNILIGYFDEDISRFVNRLHPQRGQIGGWTRVFNYCGSANFKNDFADNEYLIIQIDTDRSFEFDIPHEVDGVKRSVEELIEAVQDKFEKHFENAFGSNFFKEFGHRILFAIAVQEIECWLLPLYYADTKDQEETNQCYYKLNKKVKGLKKEFGFYVNEFSTLRSQGRLKRAYTYNPSFKIFFENELTAKVPKNTEGV